jgi:hypothetical protein
MGLFALRLQRWNISWMDVLIQELEAFEASLAAQLPPAAVN